MTSAVGFRDDPAADDFERPPVCSPNEDDDGDGVYDEIDPALVDHMEFVGLTTSSQDATRSPDRRKTGWPCWIGLAVRAVTSRT